MRGVSTRIAAEVLGRDLDVARRMRGEDGPAEKCTRPTKRRVALPAGEVGPRLAGGNRWRGRWRSAYRAKWLSSCWAATGVSPGANFSGPPAHGGFSEQWSRTKGGSAAKSWQL